jgi:phosphatidylserine/phosphatidylglycerophosphate/cardiolipin synthase-like enzyme
MAKFLNTRKAVSEIDDLIRNAGQTLILISPYLKLAKDFKDLLTYRNSKDKVTIIIFREQALKIDELKFLEELRLVKLKSNESIHAKCYLNDEKMVITSLNLYEFSMAHNKEMGVLIERSNPNDIELFDDAYKEIDYIKETSTPFNYTTKSESANDFVISKIETVAPQKTTLNGKYFSATALSKEIGISSKDLTFKIEKLKWIEKKNEEWVLTSIGKSKGAEIKKGQYGEYIAYPETVIKELM